MEPAPELVLLMERLFRSFAALDPEALIGAVSRHSGSLFIGTAPEEWGAEHDVIAALMRVQYQEMPPLHFDVEELVAWKEGTVGWVATRARMEAEGMPSVLTRGTVVLREDAAYRHIVHLSARPVHCPWRASLASTPPPSLLRKGSSLTALPWRAADTTRAGGAPLTYAAPL